MHRTFVSSFVLVVALAASAGAQAKPAQAGAAKAITWSDLAGEWNGQSMRGKSDSVITTSTWTFSADKKVAVKFPNREPIAARVVTMGGDSVVVEAGPYASITRQGHQVTTTMTMHVANHKMTGTFSAKFDDGQSLTGTSTASHKM